MKAQADYRIVIGGLTELGIDPSSRYLLCVSHSGRGVWDLEHRQRVARDYEEPTDSWFSAADRTALGIGPIDGTAIAINGLHFTPTVQAMRVAEQLGYPDEDDEYRGLALSPDGCWFAVGYPDVIEIHRLESEPG